MIAAISASWQLFLGFSSRDISFLTSEEKLNALVFLSGAAGRSRHLRRTAPQAVRAGGDPGAAGAALRRGCAALEKNICRVDRQI